MRPLVLLSAVAGTAALIAVAFLVLSDDPATQGGLAGVGDERGALSALDARGLDRDELRAGTDVRRGSGELLGAEQASTRAGLGRISSGRVVRDRDGVSVPNLDLRLSSANPLPSQMQGWKLRRELLERFSPSMVKAFDGDLKGASSLGELARVSTDDNGRFQIPGEQEGWFVSIDDPFYYLVRPSEPIFGRREEILEVALGGRIAGKVSLPDRPQEPALAMLTASGGGFGGGFGGGRGGFPFRGGFDPSQMMRGAELDSEGSFAFDGLPAGEGSRYQVWIVAPGLATYSAPPIDLKPGIEQRIDVALNAGIEVRGIVRDRSGAAIRSAHIEVAYEGPANEADTNNNGPDRRGGRGGRGGDDGVRGLGGAGGWTRFLASAEPFFEATSDASGVFVLRGLGDGEYRISVTAQGFVPETSKRLRVLYGNHDELVIDLDPSRTIEGFVRSADGKGVGGAIVSASEIREDEGNWFGGFGGDMGGGRGGGMRDMFRNAFGASPEATTDGRGHFVLPDVPATWNTVALLAATETGLRGSKEVGAMKPNQVDQVEITVGPTAGIVADLVYPEGSTPAEQLTLSLMSGQMPMPQRTETFTWPSQRVALVDVAPGDYNLLVQAKGFAATSLEVKVEDPVAATEVLVSLQPGAEIRGLAVESMSGRPIGGAEIQVEFDFGAMRGGEGRASEMLDQMRNMRVTTRTDERGQFVLTDLAAGKLSLRGEHPEFPTGRGPSIELKPGQVVEEYRLSFVPGGTITGTVIDGAGAPRANVQVLATSSAGNGGRGGFGARPVRTDDNGIYKIERLEPGEYRVALSNGGGGGGRGGRGGPGGGEIVGAMKTIEVLPGQIATVDFDASDEPLGTLVGTLKDGDAPVRGGTARLTVAGSARTLSARIDEMGVFRFEDLPLGTHRISFQPQTEAAEGGRRGRGPSGGGAGVEVELTQTGETQREFTLPGGIIAGVVGGANVNLRNVRVRLLALETSGLGREVASASVDRESGAFRFEHLDPGKYRVVADPPRQGGGGGRQNRGNEPAANATPANGGELAAAALDVELTPNASREGISLSFPVGGKLNFTVLEDGGQPVPNARVTLRGTSGTTLSIENSGGGDREGKGSVGGLAPGIYDATISARGYATTFGGEVVIAAGGEVERSFRVAKGASFSVEIVDVAGQPVPDARIEVRGESGELLGSFPSQGGGRFGGSGGRQVDGIYTLGTYPEGRYRLVVARGAAARQESFNVRHADGARARISLAKEE